MRQDILIYDINFLSWWQDQITKQFSFFWLVNYSLYFMKDTFLNSV